MEDTSTQPSDDEITSAVWEILRENMNLSRNEIKSQLESNLGWDLADKKVLSCRTTGLL